MAEVPPKGLLNTQSYGTVAPYDLNMVQKTQGLLAQGFMKMGYGEKDAYTQANKVINTRGGVGGADFTPLAGDLIGAQDTYDMGSSAKDAFNRGEYLKSLGYGAGSAVTGMLSALGVGATVAPSVDKLIDAARVGVKKATGLLNDADKLGFYSPTERLAANLQPKGTGQQYLGILAKGDGQGSRIQEEMQDMGLDTWLQSKGKVSRDEVLDYIGDNRLRYGKTVQKTDVIDPNDIVEQTTPTPKYQGYSQEGGTNYQENLLTVPREANKDIIIKQTENNSLGEPRYRAIHRQSGLEVSNGGVVVQGGSPNEVMMRAERAIEEMGGKAGAYKSPHYRTANIGLTTRTQSMNTPQGDSVHLMDELQSDWHSDGRSMGYKTDERKYALDVWEKEKVKIDARAKELNEEYGKLPDNPWGNTGTIDDIPPHTEAQNALHNKRLAVSEELRAHHEKRPTLGKVPNAPSKNSWMNQGIKKEINQTIADGKDYFAWTGGDIQARRYDLSNQVDGLRIDRIGDNKYEVWGQEKGTSKYMRVDTGIKGDDLHKYVGKDLSEKALKDIKDKPSASFTAEGVDLEVGGEGMKGFYDKDVKKRTEKIIKKLDPNAKVEIIELDNGNKVWGVKITDKMRGTVKDRGGMPLYSIAPIAGAGLLAASMNNEQQPQPTGILEY
tara:strand:+ start:40 stop:2037 length:1998 start_codon:yes stop_codon:yes gene_type:complete